MKRGAPISNQNARKGKLWTDAIRRALAVYEDDQVKRGQALSKIALRLVKDALNGDKAAWQEIGNRLDGKPTEHLEHSGTSYPSMVTEALAETDRRIARFLEETEDQDPTETRTN